MMDKLKGLGNSLLGILLKLILLFSTHVAQAILDYRLTISNSNLTDKEVIQSTFRASISVVGEDIDNKLDRES